MRKEVFLGPVFIIVIWYILYITKFINPLFLPPPHAVFLKLMQLLVESTVWKEIGVTLFRTVAGFILAAFIGIHIGLFMGYYPKISSSFDFLVDFFRSLPVYYPLFAASFVR